MNNQLLLEGAVAGHMNHIYDNGEMTFGELKQLLQAAVDGKLRGTEKTDGQNVFLEGSRIDLCYLIATRRQSVGKEV